MKLKSKFGTEILASLMLFLTTAAYGTTSTFDSGAEGWTGSGDIAAPVQWMATGGIPGGQISLLDAVVGGVTYSNLH